MTTTPQLVLLESQLKKNTRAISIFLHSVKKLQKAPVTSMLEEPDLMEPYDALINRFERAVDLLLNKTTKSVSIFEENNASGTLRDRLNLMEKLNLISSTDLWLEMREARNKIAPDYISDKVIEIYNMLFKKYKTELENTSKILVSYGTSKGCKF